MSENGIDGVDLGRGLTLPNPVGLASGTAGYGFELDCSFPSLDAVDIALHFRRRRLR